MAEEILYDQIEEVGDPDPLGLRKKLAATKAKPDPLGLRVKAPIAQPSTPLQPQAFQVQISQPTFGQKGTALTKEEGTVISPQGITAPRGFSFEKPYDPLAVTKLGGKAREAQKVLHSELQANDKEYEKKLREYRRDSYTLENLREDYKNNGWVLPPQDEQSVLKKEKQKRYDAPINATDISDIKTGTFLNEVGSRRFIKDLNKPDVLENAYLVDKYNELANAPDGNHRVEKIQKVAKQIKKGEVKYDPESKIAYKPLGLVGSILEGTMNKFKMEEKHDFFKNTENDAAIISELEDQRNNPDTDEPLKVPKGKAQEFLMMASEMPWSPMIAGAIGSLVGPEGGLAAASAVGAYENRKIQFATTFEQVYNELRDQGVNEYEALQEARKQANDAQEIGTVVGAAQGYFGAKIGAAPLKSANFGAGYQKAIGELLKQNGNELGKMLMEGAAQGGIGAMGEVAKNKLAQAVGINRDIDAGTAEQFWTNLFMTAGIGVAIKGGRGLSKINYKRVLNGLKNVPEDQVNGVLQEKVNEGAITQEAANSALQEINEYRGLDKLIPDNVTEEARFKIQDKIERRRQLEKRMEVSDEAYHPELKERIKILNEEIIALSKETEKPTKAESGLSRPHEKEAIEIAEELLAEGILPDTYKPMIEADPIGFWKMIAQQAQNRDDQWRPLSEPIEESAVREQFGDTVVEYAKELFPAPELPASTENVSVIMSGEIKQPETITISPREQPNTVSSTERVSVIMPKGSEQKPITIKPKEDAIPERSAAPTIVDETSGGRPEMGEPVPESGEAAIPQEGVGQPKEEGIIEGQKEQVEPRQVGITHRQMDAIAKEYGLDTYEKSPERVKEWDEQAAVRLTEEDALPRLFDKLRNGELPDAVETRMMLQYMGDLMAKIDQNPGDEALLIQLKRTKDLFNIAGRLQGKGLAARKGSIPVEERLGDFLVRDMEANKAPLTEEQKAQSIKEYEEIKAAKDKYEQEVNRLSAENTQLKADKQIQKVAKESKKQNKDYKSERKQILDDIKKKWDDSKGQLSATFIPYADRLVKIAPDVMKLVKNVVEEGVVKLPEVIRAVHKQIKDILPNVTESDIHNIIAGEYSQKRTKTQLQETLYDLRTEAKYINRLQALEAGIEPKNEKAKIKRNREIEELKQKIKEHDLTKLAAYKKRVQSQISKIEEQLRKGDFTEPEKQEVKLDAEAQAARDRLIELRKERERRIALMEYENRTKIEKVKDKIVQYLGVPRSLMASADFSAPLRQGIVATVAHPAKAAKALPEMFKQAFSQKNFDRWMADLKESPDYSIMEEAGLYVADPDTLHPLSKEESFVGSNLAEKIPIYGKIIKGSERAYVAYLNKMRVDLFRQGVELFEADGKTIENSKELYEGLASYINNATGRGGLGGLEKAAHVLNTAFFSPRLIASRINMLNPLYYTSLPKEVRMMAIKDMAKLVGFGASILGLAQLAGAEVEKDPRSSDFGKIKVGNTRWDIWGGFQQYVRIFSQLATGETKSTTSGQIRQLKGDEFPYKSRLDQLGNFFRGKLAPVPGTAVDALAGRNVIGEEFDIGNKAAELFVPMIYQDIRDAWNDQGFSSIFTAGVPAAFGVGVSTFGGEAPKKKESDSGKSSSPKKGINRNRSHEIKHR